MARSRRPSPRDARRPGNTAPDAGSGAAEAESGGGTGSGGTSAPSTKAASEPPSDSARSRLSRRLIAIIVVPLVLLSLVGGSIFADWYVCRPAGIVPTYVGRATCAQCHAHETELFTGSHHDLAMDVATDATVLADFDDATLEHDGLTTRFYRRDDAFMVETEGVDGKPTEYRVRYVFGVAPLQQYVVELDRPEGLAENETSRAQVLRASWDVEQGRWFFLRPPDVDERILPGDPLHWTGSTQCWNTSCADCHSTGVRKNFDPETLEFRTSYQEIDVSCEACHGPGSLHVELAGESGLFWDRRYGYGLAKFAREEPKVEIETCARCHSRRNVLDETTLAGQRLTDGMACELIAPSIYHPDGQILDEDFEYGSFAQSRMYHKQIRCTDCHDPHTARTRYPGNSLCTTCHQHPAGKYDTAAHHHHKVGSTGSQCVDCHMPESHYMEIDGRRDHSIRIPRPDLSVSLGTPNACTQCHLSDSKLPETRGTSPGRYQDWLAAARDGDDEVRAELERIDRFAAEAMIRWYGPKERPTTFAPAFAAAWRGDESAADELAAIVRSTDTAAIVRASALRSMGLLEADSGIDESIAALADPEPMVQAAALERVRDELRRRLVRIAEPGGFDPVAELVEPVLPLLRHPSRWVRNEAASTIAALGPERDRFLDRDRRAEFDAAILALRDSLRLNADRSGAHLGLGLLAEDLGEFDRAIQAYRDGIRVEPNVVGPRSNLARLLADQADSLAASAERSLAGAMQSGGARALEMRGALDEMRREEERLREEAKRLWAEELPLLQREAEQGPNLVGLQYRYAMLLYLNRRVDEAGEVLERVRALEPDRADQLYFLARIRKEQGRWADLLPLAETLVRLDPRSAEYRLLLEESRRQVTTGSGGR